LPFFWSPRPEKNTALWSLTTIVLPINHIVLDKSPLHTT
jgi:hypothetical protein